MTHKSLFSEPWAMEEVRLAQFASSFTTDPSSLMIEGLEVHAAAPMSTRRGNVAVIPIKGVLMKSVPRWMRWFGYEATGYDDIAKMVGAAAMNDSVTSIELNISSPGGQVAGILTASNAIAKAAGIKPVSAVCEDLCASAAYWLASQAMTITADSNTEIGSIGVYAAIADYSKMAEGMGIKVHVIRSGDLKGAGVIGAAITDDQLAAFQENIDAMAVNFKKVVAAGRGLSMEAVEKIASGRTWLAAAALKKKLVDTVIDPKSEDDVVGKQKGVAMSNENEDKVVESSVDVEAIASQVREDDAKRFSGLRTAFPDDLAFAVEQYEAGASVEQAKAAMCDRLMEEKKNTPPPKPEPAHAAAAVVEGVTPIGAGNPGADDSVPGDFIAEARSMRKANPGMSMTQAMRSVQAESPELYAAFKDKAHRKILRITPAGTATRVS